MWFSRWWMGTEKAKSGPFAPIRHIIFAILLLLLLLLWKNRALPCSPPLSPMPFSRFSLLFFPLSRGSHTRLYSFLYSPLPFPRFSHLELNIFVRFEELREFTGASGQGALGMEDIGSGGSQNPTGRVPWTAQACSVNASNCCWSSFLHLQTANFLFSGKKVQASRSLVMFPPNLLSQPSAQVCLQCGFPDKQEEEERKENDTTKWTTCLAWSVSMNGEK